MKKALTAVTALALLVTTLATPASARHATVFIYTPVANKSWVFTSLDGPNHPAGYLWSARDVSGSWTTDEGVTFNVGTSGRSLQGWVETATTNCPVGGPDKFVKIQLWVDGEYYGKVAYVHLRTLNVSTNSWISPGTLLGRIQNAESWYNGNSCWTGLHSHMEELYGTWQSVGLQQWQSSSTWILAYTGIGIMAPSMTPQQLTDNTKRGPVIR